MITLIEKIHNPMLFAPIKCTMDQLNLNPALDFLHDLGTRIAAADPLHEVLDEIVEFVADLVSCDSCFIFVLEGDELVLRASKNPHPEALDRLKMQIGQGITGWVAAHREPVAIPEKAAQDPRFQYFHELPEDSYEAFLSVPLVSGGDVTGVINVHHKRPYAHTPEHVALLSFMGEQMGGAIARSRVMDENARLQEESLEIKRQLEARKLIERAKGILQSKYNLTEEDAYLRLRGESRRLRRPMRDLAEAIILAQDVITSGPEGPLPLEELGADGLRPQA